VSGFFFSRREKMKKHTLIKTMAEVAVFSGLGYVLDLLAGMYSQFLFINGGSIGIAMACVFFMSFRRGLVPGLATGLIIGLLQLAGGTVVSGFADTPWKVFCQIALDYWLAYPASGLAGVVYGLFKRETEKGKRIKWIIVGSLIGGLAKYLCHYLSGVLFWPDDEWNVGGPYIYSLLYNGSYMLPCIILSTLLVVVLFVRVPILFNDPDNYSLKSKPQEETTTK
jgi:thiamine transporter